MGEFGTPMKYLRGYLTSEEVKHIIACGKNDRDKLLMEVLWVTGARVSEIVDLQLGLKPNDIFKEENVIILRTLKRRMHPPPERRVVIPDSTMAKLAERARDLRAYDRLFAICRSRVFRIVRESGTRAGITVVGDKPLHPHHFRHSHCVAYVRGGNNTMEGLRKLQARLNHSNFATTAGYLQFGTSGETKTINEIFG